MYSLKKNIEFTYVIKESIELLFIGVDFEWCNENFVTSVFSQPTYSGLLPELDSLIPDRSREIL